MWFRAWLCVVGVLTVSPALAADLIGRATVTDGDTLTVAQQRIRLWGIDAPESAQQCTARNGQAWPCGRRAAAALDAYVQDKTVRCQPKDTDRYGRIVAECFVQGQSINAWMVRSGWAVAYRQYATAFVADEAIARQQASQLWSGSFQIPSEYRRAKRNASPSLRQARPHRSMPVAPSRAMSRRRAPRSSICPDSATTQRHVSLRPMASGCSAASGKHWMRAGARRSVDLQRIRRSELVGAYSAARARQCSEPVSASSRRRRYGLTRSRRGPVPIGPSRRPACIQTQWRTAAYSTAMHSCGPRRAHDHPN